MTLPKWTTFVILVAMVVQFVVAWLRAKRSRKSFRSAVLPNALMAVAMSIVFAHELLRDVPAWIDNSLALIALLLFLSAGVGFLGQLKHYLNNAWHQQEKEQEYKNQ